MSTKDSDNNLKRILNFALAAFGILSILPFCLLCLYIHPFIDDYWILANLATDSVIGATKFFYMHVTGRYSSIFIEHVLGLGADNLSVFRTYPLLLMSLFLSMFYFFFRQLFKQTISSGKLLIISLLFLILYIYKIPDITTGFYYLSCAWVSSIGTVALIGLLGIFLRLTDHSATTKKGPFMILGCLLSIVIGGSYEPVMVLALLLTFSITGVLLFRKDRNRWYFVAIAVVLFVSVLFSILAPGNRERGGNSLVQFSLSKIITSVFHSVIAAENLIVNTLQSPLLIVFTLLFIPIAVYLNRNNESIKRNLNFHPLIAFLFMGMIISIAFFPSVWVGDFIARIVNQLYMMVLLGWFVCIQVLVNHLLKKNIDISFPAYSSYILKVGVLLCLIPSLSNKTVGRAYSDLMTKAKLYDQRVLEEKVFIQNMRKEGKMDIVLPQLFSDPQRYPLTIFDNYHCLSTDSANFSGKKIAQYLHVRTIRYDSTTATDFLTKSRTN